MDLGLNWIDLIIIITLFVFVLEALGRSLVIETLDFLSFLLAFFLSLKFYNLPAKFFETQFDIPRSLSLVIGFMVVWFFTEITFYFIAKLVLNKMAERIRLDKIDDEDKKLTLLYSALCHDLGKAATTKFEDGRLRSKGHAEASLKQAEQFLNSLHPQNVNQNIIKGVLKLIKNHLFIGTNYDKEKDELKISDKKIKSKAKELEPLSLVDLERISRADNCGRLYEDQRFRAGELFLERAEKLKVLDEPLPYILGGKDLIKLGLKPGILFGKILKEIYDKQLNGEIKTKEEAIEFVKENFIR